MIRTDQSPRFGTHVIRGLTDKFNHHRVKVYHLHEFRDLRSVFCALPLPHTLKRAHAERERERGTIQIPLFRRTDTYTHKVRDFVLFFLIQLRKNMQNSCVSCVTICRYLAICC